MCHLKNIVLFLLFSFCVLGCSSSVWKSETCRSIDRHVSSVSSIDFPQFKLQKDDKVFRISDALNLPVGMVHDFSFSWLAIGCSNQHPMADGLHEEHDKPASAIKAPHVSGISGIKTSSGNTEKNNGTLNECININTAEAAQLMTLPGIGQARAEAIVLARNQKAFRRKKDITRIKGISVKAYQKMQVYLCEL